MIFTTWGYLPPISILLVARMRNRINRLNSPTSLFIDIKHSQNIFFDFTICFQDHGPQRYRTRALRRRPWRAEDPAGLQVPSGHHRHPGYGRVVRGGQAEGRQGQEDREIPFPAIPGE